MALEDPRREVVEPLRRALDAIVLRWLGVYVLAATCVVCPFLCGWGLAVEDVVHACLPIFLVGFIGVHLLWRRPTLRHDGWRRAFEAEPGAARLALAVGGVAMAGVLFAMVAIYCPLGERTALAEALGIWFPILAPLYAGAIWVAIDCSVCRLGRSADASDRRFRSYWKHLSAR